MTKNASELRPQCVRAFLYTCYVHDFSSHSLPAFKFISCTDGRNRYPELLERMAALYPRSPSDLSLSAYVEDPWFLITALAFAASNRPDGVPKVLAHVLHAPSDIEDGKKR